MKSPRWKSTSGFRFFTKQPSKLDSLERGRAGDPLIESPAPATGHHGEYRKTGLSAVTAIRVSSEGYEWRGSPKWSTGSGKRAKKPGPVSFLSIFTMTKIRFLLQVQQAQPAKSENHLIDRQNSF